MKSTITTGKSILMHGNKKRYLGSEKTLSSQSILPAAVGKAVVLGFQDREAAGKEEATVEELKGGTAAWRLTGIHANVIQYVPKHRL